MATLAAALHVVAQLIGVEEVGTVGDESQASFAQLQPAFPERRIFAVLHELQLAETPKTLKLW